ncbi:MAG: hypothetical protein M3454_10375 [Actinomycetota bacterium]|nr:hypothetical protein [Actinomycetota bacterium]
MRVLKPGGLFVLNCKDHIRARKRVEVVDWHVAALERLGLVLKDRREVESSGYGFGANRDARLPEEVLYFVKDRSLSVEELHRLAAE